MPNIKSAKKRVKVAEKKTLANKIVKSELKTAIKKAKATGEPEKINYAIKRVDQAAAKNIFHKNKANRKKSQLAKLANVAGVANAAAE
jgi:ribosomal protein S20